MMTEKKIVLPGDELSTSEELLSGEGTFEEDGIIRATNIGTYYVDSKHKRAKVKPLTSTPVILKRGDLVLAEVRMIRSNMVIAEVIHVIGKKRPISGDTNGTLKVSEISKGYIKDPADVFSMGDIIRAKVTQVKPSIQLHTKDQNLGVIKGLCSKCRSPLIKKDNKLECSQCGNRERRITSNDYGNFNLNNL
jgi:exosome complex component CSL4